jgi:pyruvyltransferase
MPKVIKLYYHDGFYDLKNPFFTLKNLIKFGKIHQPVYNIGDQISPIIVSAISDHKVKHAQPFQKNKLIAIGSILASLKDGDTVWGSGLMKAEHIQFIISAKNTNIRAVRGPLTYRALKDAGMSCDKVFGDPALLMPQFFKPKVEKKYKLGIIPHLTQETEFQQQSLDKHTILISPRAHWRQFINQILQCEYIVSSSLHGVILSDAYGIPASPMKHSDFLHGTPFKFLDYFLSTDREIRFMSSIDAFNFEKVKSFSDSFDTPKFDLTKLINAFPYSSLGLGSSQQNKQIKSL